MRNGDTLRFVDVESMRALGDLKVGGRISYLVWLFPDRFLAVVSGSHGTTLVWVDARRRRVLGRRDLDTTPWTVAAGGGTAVALLAPRQAKIGGARLAVATGDGRLRVVAVQRVQIGFALPNPRDREVARRVSPGLAVTSAGERAYLVGGAGTVAEIDLHSLTVSYHSPQGQHSFLSRIGAWLEPTAQAKGVDGPQLQARWLGNGVVAVAGMRYHLQQKPYRQLAATTGLRLIDTRTWTQRTLDDRAGGFTVAGDTLLAFGVRSDWRDGQVMLEGMGIAAYDAGGTKRFEALPDAPVSSVAAGNGRAYAWRSDRGTLRQVTIIDLEAGTVEREVVFDHPTWLLVGPQGS